MFKVRYDRRADVLYVSTDRNGPAVAREGDDGIVWRYLRDDGALVGVTIMDFAAYWLPRLDGLVAQIAARFHVPQKDAEKALELADG